jgi:geranylgeranyl diphosphate synthase type II
MSGGGKRIRPVLVMIACGAVGGEPEKAVKPATAIEILHNFTLVHDDIMDESPMRRNKPTVHTKWDEATAILTGDVMIGHAFNLLPKPVDHPRSGEVFDAFTKGLIDVCEGQVLDMNLNKANNINIIDYVQMIGMKTASLLEAACVIGGNMGLATEDQIGALRCYAFNFGLAFQIQDDLLDLTADQAKLGKKIGQDIIDGKITYLVIKAIERAKSEGDRELLSSLVKFKGLSDDFIPVMREMFERLGVLDEAEKEASNLLDKACDSLKVLPENEYREMLVWFAGSLVKRKY